MWIDLKKYIGRDFQISRKALVATSIKKEMMKKNEKDKMEIETPFWRVILWVNGISLPIEIDCLTEKQAVQVRSDISDI